MPQAAELPVLLERSRPEMRRIADGRRTDRVDGNDRAHH